MLFILVIVGLLVFFGQCLDGIDAFDMKRVFCSDSLRSEIVFIFSCEFIDYELELEHVPHEDLVVAVVPFE